MNITANRCIRLTDRLLNRPAIAARQVKRSFSPSRPLHSASRLLVRAEKIRILFLGSDSFSNASLRALHQSYVDDPECNIGAIHVGYRPAKPSGRGLKKLIPPPIQNQARDLGLPTFEIPTFTGWTPPIEIDLIVAASFRLKIPPRILGLSRYGGWNLHPSLLPELPGAAPLHWTLLLERQKTGVTLQTVHPRFFDAGAIIMQTGEEFKYGRDPYLFLPADSTLTVKELGDSLGSHGAKMLVKAIQDRRYLEHFPVSSEPLYPDEQVARWPTPEDQHVDWETWNPKEILSKQRLLGPLWEERQGSKPSRSRRCIWSDISLDGFDQAVGSELPPGSLFVIEGDEEIDPVRVKTSERGVSMLMKTLKLDGETVMPARRALAKAGIPYLELGSKGSAGVPVGR